MGPRFFLVDAFTSTPFLGNPAAVCILPAPRSEDWMQQVAHEMNVSETAFITEQAGQFGLRWFTPVVEVDLCGHATLASAHVLWEAGVLSRSDCAFFSTRSGVLTARCRDNMIELDFPALIEEPAAVPPPLLAALGLEPKYSGKFGAKNLIEVANEAVVRKLTPDFTAMRRCAGRGVVVTSVASDPEYDFVSRYFAPWVGIDEDPVTGSAHCCLGPFWAKRLGKGELKAHQASQRGGSLSVRMERERVYLGGRAVTIFTGELCV